MSKINVYAVFWIRQQIMVIIEWLWLEGLLKTIWFSPQCLWAACAFLSNLWVKNSPLTHNLNFHSLRLKSFSLVLLLSVGLPPQDLSLCILSVLKAGSFVCYSPRREWKQGQCNWINTCGKSSVRSAELWSTLFKLTRVFWSALVYIL